jgi:uncharacterized membrane protein (UPF0127 family)
MNLALGLRMRALFILFVIAFVAGEAHAALPTVKLDVGGHAVTAEVAATPSTRQTGLMNRFSLPADSGMIFVFARPSPQAFWMRNTYIPLSIAFIDKDGRILNIEDMAPQTDTTHWSLGEALYALEMRQGWFAQKGVRAGDRVSGLPKPGLE